MRISLLAAVAALFVFAAPVRADEQLLTLYSPPIDSEPYVHASTTVSLKPDGKAAPKEPGYVLGFQEMALVDSKDPDARPLPVAKMMVHHFLYYTNGRVDPGPGGCLGNGFLAGRGEEHPNGRFDAITPPDLRARYGIRNATPSGEAPSWTVTAMVMNHYKKTKRFYVRTRIWYTTEPREQVYPVTVGNCAHLVKGMAYDVPGGAGAGSTFTDRSTWTVPFTGRILGAASHHHGGAINQTLRSVSCNRELYNARAYYGAANHPYNTIRPILHEPGPIANGTFRSSEGVPVTEGEVLERSAVHSNARLHVAAMGFWVLTMIKDDGVTGCAPFPGDVREVTKPARYDGTAPYVYDRVVPQLLKPTGRWRAFPSRPLAVGDRYFARPKATARVGQKLSWRFAGVEPHSVTVANGPRGFSSNYLGITAGTYSFTPTVRGTYRLTCLIHPTTMSQTVKVR